ncbi:MAG: ribonuclease D [Proteobacteria bacterium]|nr:ribonuclease D [Pseudomonadota bacterium]
MPIITDTQTLSEFCDRLRGSKYITVDTEFMREKTYWPILCLVQVAGPNDAKAIDALAPGIDLSPLFELMADDGILKVFHAARQDLEIFHHLAGVLPTPVFDTQVAAMVCGFGDSVGYEALITDLVNAKIDKGSRFTDWTLRPLSERQVDYAMADVTHLRPAYDKLAAKLHENGREQWVEEEMEVLENPNTYTGNPTEAFRRIKARSTGPRMLAILRELAAWRELEAQNRDVPRNRIIREESLVEIAHHAPTTTQQLGRTRGLGEKMVNGSYGQGILEAVKKGLAVPDKDCPQPNIKPKLPRGIGPVTDLLKVLLKMKSEDSGVASKLLASASDVEVLAAFGADADVKALTGWRRKAFGEDALKLRSGELALSVKGKRLKLLPTGTP